MARPPKISPDQWRDIERRAAAGEAIRAIARDYGVSESALRKRVSAQSAQVRTVAHKLAEAHSELAMLPIPQQHIAVSLADDLRQISTHLGGAARYGAATAHRLNALAHSEVAKVDDASPLSGESMEAMRGVAALTKLANDSASIALNLLAANKDTVKQLNEPADRADANDDDTRAESLARGLEARIGRATA